MSISVTQEEAKFRPVTIIIDDERTANMLRYAIDNFCNYPPDFSAMLGNIYMIENVKDVEDSLKDLRVVYQSLERLILD